MDIHNSNVSTTTNVQMLASSLASSVEPVKRSPPACSSSGAAKQSALPPPLAPLSSGAAAQQWVIKQTLPNIITRSIPHVVVDASASSLSLPLTAPSSGAAGLPAKQPGSIQQSLPPPLAPLSSGEAARSIAPTVPNSVTRSTPQAAAEASVSSLPLPLTASSSGAVEPLAMSTPCTILQPIVPDAFRISPSVAFSPSSSAANIPVRQQDKRKATSSIAKRARKSRAKRVSSAIKPSLASEVHSSLTPLPGLDTGRPLMNDLASCGMKHITGIPAPFLPMSPLGYNESEMVTTSSDTLSSALLLSDSLTHLSLPNTAVNSRAAETPTCLSATGSDVCNGLLEENELFTAQLPHSSSPATTRTPDNVDNRMLLRELQSLREFVEHSIQTLQKTVEGNFISFY
ncbi:calphotin-like [Anopheles merus]|uniref:calphotin-like n=1 Tax=Anopheles merus TaxID=30066 RepID=UPI001BE44036|nr:calphotin-like [Anopheles merus]